MAGATHRTQLALVTALILLLTSIPSSLSAAGTTPLLKNPKSTPVNSTPPLPTPSSLSPELDGGKPSLSSAVFPIYGDVYPHGLYFVAMSIGDPPMPYFLDVDTGSDLTWLQCDAPCVSCSKGPHPLYRPRKNGLVECKDPICEAVRAVYSENKECESLEQCDYEIQYADQLSSLGVLVSDAVSLRLANRSLVRAQLAFG